MKDAMEWKKSQQKANKNRDHEESSKSSAKKSSANKAPVSDTSAEVKRNDKSQTGADNKLDVPQEAAICGNNNKEPMEIKRKASSPTSSAKSSSPPTLPRLTGPSPPAQQAAVGSNDQLKFNVREVTSEKSCFSSETLPPSKEKSQEPGNQGEVTSSSSRRKRNQRKKKASKSLKWLNPFSKQSNDEQGYLSSVNMDPNVPKNDSSDVVEGGAVANGEELSKRRKENVVLCSTPVEPVLKKAKPCVAVSVREYEELDGYRRSPELETSSSNGSTLDEARPIPPVDASPCEKETPLHPEAVSDVTNHFTELSQYAKEQIYLIKEEIACLEKVSVKLETEMQQAMQTKDCEEELDGLTQDWLTLSKHRSKLIERKQDLEILDKQNNFNECSSILRNELMYLFEVQAWRKACEHRALEKRLLTILVSFVSKQNSITRLD